jgi:hypothetical protein
MGFYGPKWPLKRGNEDTYEVYTDLKDQTNFYLRNLLLTSPGENISDPNYGVGLRRFLFEPNIDEIREEILSVLYQQVNIYLPDLNIKNISVTASGDEVDSNTLKVSIIYSMSNRTQREVFEMDFSQSDSIGFY